MCLKVFLHGDAKKYNKLENGAKALGSSYQKVNFLRDIGDDYRRLGRCYFPKINPNSITQKDKDRLIKDIRQDFQKARIAINQLPDSSKRAVSMSYIYYTKLLDKLEATPAAKLTQQRVRIPNTQKLWLYAKLRLRLG
jgi:phytoene/squalene synthetase